MSKLIIPHCTGCKQFNDLVYPIIDCEGCESYSLFKPIIDPHEECRRCVAFQLPGDQWPCLGCEWGSKYSDGRVGCLF